MRIIWVGGTYDPIHNGHREIIKRISGTCTHEDKIFVMPSKNPDKVVSKRLFTEKQRLDMVELTTAGIPHVTVSDYEINKPYISPTLDTLQYLHHQYPKAELEMVIGADSFQRFDQWDNGTAWAPIMNLVNKLHVFDRPGALRKTTTWMGEHTEKVEFHELKHDISATKIRIALQAAAENNIPLSREILDFLHPTIIDYIRDNKPEFFLGTLSCRNQEKHDKST